ncbi:MAG: SCO family protein [Tepidisphaeraceae bacterium]
MLRCLRQLLCPTLAVAALGLPALTPIAHAGVGSPTQQLPPDRFEPVPPKFKRDTAGVGITEHLGDKIPLDGTFTETSGKTVKLGDYFNQGKPIILQLGYFNCPMLCDVVSKGIMDGVKDLNLEMGKDYDVLFVSVNPKDTWQLAQRKKTNYVEEYGKPGAVKGWNFLVGQDDAIQKLADAVGFNFKKVEGKDQFSHPPMIVVLTADGRISRYFYGVQYPADLLRTGLVEAGDGKVGSYVEQILVGLCYCYDDYSGKYTLASMNLMRMAGGLTVLVLGTVLVRRWWKDSRRRKAVPA